MSKIPGADAGQLDQEALESQVLRIHTFHAL
jgi:hypothetical protein